MLWYTYTDSGIEITASGTYARVGFLISVKVGETYTFSYNGYSSGEYRRVILNSAVTWGTPFYAQQITETETAYTKTFTATTDILFVGFYVTASGTTGSMSISNIMLEVGSSVSAFEPYSGETHTANIELPTAKVNDLSKLTWNGGSGLYNTADIADYKNCVPTCSAYTGGEVVSDNWDDLLRPDKTIFFRDTETGTRLYIRDDDGGTVSNFVTTLANVSMEYELATPAKVYGGSADFASGHGESTHANVKVSDLTWTKQTASGRDFFIAQVSDMKTGTPKDIDSVLPYGGEITVAAMADKSLASWTNSLRIYDTDITSVSELLEAYGNDGISYPLATPETFTFDPVPIDSKLGNNTLWSEQGSSAEVTYRGQGKVTVYPNAEEASF